jgi:hypothetical protein
VSRGGATSAPRPYTISQLELQPQTLSRKHHVCVPSSDGESPIVGSSNRNLERPRVPCDGLLLMGTPPPLGSWLRQPVRKVPPLLVRPGAPSLLCKVLGQRRAALGSSRLMFWASALSPREVQMNKITKLSLATILASCLLAATAIGSAHSAMRHHQAATACAAQPGTLRAFFCPAPAAPAKPLHHRHAKA